MPPTDPAHSCAHALHPLMRFTHNASTRGECAPLYVSVWEDKERDVVARDCPAQSGIKEAAAEMLFI